MKRIQTAMVFAAGRGTRMRELSRDRPKSLIPVEGKALIDHALDLLADEVPRAVVNVHAHADQLEAHLAGRETPAITISDEREMLLETGGGLAHAERLLGPDPILTLNSDAVWAGPNPIHSLPPPPAGGAVLLVAPRERAIGHLGVGDFFLEAGGRLSRRGPAAEAPFVYTGLQSIDPTVVYAQGPGVYSLNTVWDQMLRADRLLGVVYPGHWCDVGQPESLPLAEAMLAGAPST